MGIGLREEDEDDGFDLNFDFNVVKCFWV